MTDAEARGASSAADPTTGRFRATPWITHERLDDEVIAINLETGEYFALDDVAADAWTLLTAGVGLEDAAGVLAERYDVGAERVRADLSAYVAELDHNRLLMPDRATTAAPASPIELPPPARPLEYAPPAVTRYDDLEVLLRLDPVHEVDEAGWPVMRAD
jgi:hypothetical protein